MSEVAVNHRFQSRNLTIDSGFAGVNVTRRRSVPSVQRGRLKRQSTLWV